MSGVITTACAFDEVYQRLGITVGTGWGSATPLTLNSCESEVTLVYEEAALEGEATLQQRGLGIPVFSP